MGRRLARFRVTPQALMALGRGTFEVIANELPADAVCVGCYHDDSLNVFVVLLESATFPAWQPGDTVLEVSGPLVRAIPELGAIA